MVLRWAAHKGVLAVLKTSVPRPIPGIGVREAMAPYPCHHMKGKSLKIPREFPRQIPMNFTRQGGPVVQQK